jgi:hypothetical protein
MKINLNKMDAFLRFSFIVLIFFLIINNASAQLSFISSGQQLNNLAGRGVVLNDFNGDKKLDAFIVNEDGPEGNGYRVYFGDGSGQFTVSSQNLTNPISWAGIPVIGDIDGDSIKEVITGWTVWKNDGNGVFTADTNRFDNRSGVKIVQMGLSYLNNDSSPDIFCTVFDGSGTSTRVYLNDGTGQFHDAGFSFGQGLPYTLALGDINGDKIVDVVTSGWKDKSSDPCPNRIGINDGSGKFTETGQLIELGMAHSHGVALGDLDKDGDLDLVIVAQQSPYCQIYFNDGNGFFTTGPKIGSKAVEKICLGDLDGDGDLDIFLACTTSNQVWINTGGGQFENSGLKLGAAVWSWSAALGDVNNDGRLDVFVANIGFDDPYVPRGRVAEVWLNTTFICDYFGETPPENTPKKFAPGIITGFKHYSIAISPKGDEIFWVETEMMTATEPRERIKYSKYKNGAWTNPAYADFILDYLIYHNGAPVFSIDGKKIFFNSDRPGVIGSNDVFYVEKDENSWGAAVNVGEPYNTNDFDVSPVFTNNGKAYRIGSTSSPASFSYSNGIFSNPEDIENQPVSEWYSSVYISPDESYVIFAGGEMPDLFIRFKNNDNEWSDPINMGDKINTNGADRFPVVSPDGKYLFFNREEGEINNYYWISTTIIDELRNTALSNTEIQIESKQIEVFPNPTSQTIQIKGIDNLFNKANYKLTDLNGKTIKQGKLKSETIDISELPKGIYILSLQTNEVVLTEKIVIE